MQDMPVTVHLKDCAGNCFIGAWRYSTFKRLCRELFYWSVTGLNTTL